MSKKTKGKPLNKYIRFTGIALQMGLTIYFGNILGKWLDVQFLNDVELYSKICTLAAVFLAMFSVIRQVSKISK